MVDEQDGAALTPGLTPEQDAAVRRLMAEARHDEPIPGDVAARLDKVLAHLANESAESAEPGQSLVVDLDARRRRRRWRAGRLVMAAAAVVVGGVALGQVLGTGGLTQGGDDAADSGATAEQNPAAGEAPAKDSDGALTEDAEKAPDPAENGAQANDDANNMWVSPGALPVTLSSKTFEQDVRKVYRQSRLAKRDASRNLVAEADSPFNCPDAGYGDGLLLPAYYDGQPTVLAFRPPVGSQRVAELLECGTAEALDELALAYGSRD